MIEAVIAYYLVFAAGFYSGALVVNIDSYRQADAISVFRGLIGCLFWPVFLGAILFYGIKGYLKSR